MDILPQASLPSHILWRLQAHIGGFAEDLGDDAEQGVWRGRPIYCAEAPSVTGGLLALVRKLKYGNMARPPMSSCVWPTRR